MIINFGNVQKIDAPHIKNIQLIEVSKSGIEIQQEIVSEVFTCQEFQKDVYNFS